MRTVGNLKQRVQLILSSVSSSLEEDFPELADSPFWDLPYFSEEALRYEQVFRAPEDGEIFCCRECYDQDDVHPQLAIVRGIKESRQVLDEFEAFSQATLEPLSLALRCLLSGSRSAQGRLFSPRWSTRQHIGEGLGRVVVEKSYKLLERIRGGLR